jgi:hypothetical protein
MERRSEFADGDYGERMDREGSGSVDSRNAERRRVRFDSLAQMRAELDRIAAAECAGRLRRTGSWTAGQVMGHLATWLEFNWSPNPLRPPWAVRIGARLAKRRFLRAAMPAGIRIPKVPGGTLGTEPMDFETGLARLVRAVERLEREEPTQRSPLFGRLSRAEAEQMALRHAELHLGFLHP